jgi:hypothetical protein
MNLVEDDDEAVQVGELGDDVEEGEVGYEE